MLNRLKLMTLPFKGSQGRGGERPYQVHPDLELYQASRERFKKTEAVFLGAFKGAPGVNRNPPRARFLFVTFSFGEVKEKVIPYRQISMNVLALTGASRQLPLQGEPFRALIPRTGIFSAPAAAPGSGT